MLRSKGKSNRSKRRQSWQRQMIAKYGVPTMCEWFDGCSNEATDNAHRLKKTKITSELEYVDGRAALCRDHHNWVEYGSRDEPSSHERMWRLINRCMENAGRFIPQYAMRESRSFAATNAERQRKA